MGKNPAELNQSVCFKDVLTSKWKSGNVLHGKRGCTFVSAENKKLYILSVLINVSFNWGRAPEGRNKKDNKTGNMNVDPFSW